MLMLYIFFIKNVNKNIVLFLLVFVQYLRIFIHFKEIIANFVGVKDGAELRITNYELRVTNYEFEWPADTSRPFPTRFGRFRNKFGMTGSIIGFFLCSRFGFALASLPRAKGVPPMLRQTGRNPNKIFYLTLNSPLHPNKINFRNVSSRRKFGIISSANSQIRKSATQQSATQ